MSLAFMPLLRPEVVKLDLRLVQDRPGPAVAEIMNAVNDYAESSGALVLAEGVESEAHLTIARALGARLGQGWLFGRPARGAAAGLPVGALTLPKVPAALSAEESPFACLPEHAPLRRSPKALLIQVSKQLERQAMRLGETCVVAATFQEARHFTPATALRYRDLVARTGFVCALGEDLPLEPVPGVRGAALQPDDPVRGEWDITVVSPHFSRRAAGPRPRRHRSGPRADVRVRADLRPRHGRARRRTRCCRGSCPGCPPCSARRPARTPRHPPPRGRPAPRPGRVPAAEALLQPRAGGHDQRRHHRRHATGPTTAGLRERGLRASCPGFRVDEVLGRNCRFLQGADTDQAAVGRIRAALAAGKECRETLLNYRGPERTPWWNEVPWPRSPTPTAGVVQYIGVQNDVTARVEAERALEQERDRARATCPDRAARLHRPAHRAGEPPAASRSGVEVALWDARVGDTRWPCCSSTSTASRPSTTRTATRPATSCSSPSPGG